ncbi:metalloproteinase inhibitor 1 [Oryctolagus cuniculus]|uniref:metalloproteinase inhibitor 1 n=1 Tax=Oryctolagus cuniculus TaxID=9986 RepID=UPI0038795816
MDASFLLALPLLLVLARPCDTCECKLLHPQTVYCMSDVVILADILGPAKNIGTRRGFKIRMKKLFKAPSNVTAFDVIYTPLDFYSCGYLVRTSFQSDLLIAGYLTKGKLIFTRCHLVYHWYQLTTEQRLGFDTGYSVGCSCNIETCILCWRKCPEVDVTDCVWKQDNCKYNIWTGNLSLFSMCVPSVSGQCQWTRAPRRRPTPTSYLSRTQLALSPTTPQSRTQS